ncbi:hypothetical protein A1359_05440 [Methylomonas lenta]|uniref:Glycosyl transferase family 1 domain-containing protein n=1 Tax=Methylomonas lenta TaxID=980561 RepID=A0A177NJ40_9GAMM|nr:hypothetical protein [Methylomonas lenta]OAI17891.1 hypothetical protein A1359_05440 [Methylomonas lenta]
MAGESADIVKQNEAGLVFEPEDSDALYQYLLKLKSDTQLYATLKTNGLAAAKKYDRTHLANEFLGLLSDLPR